VQRTYSQVSSAVGVVLQDQGRNVITVFLQFASKSHANFVLFVLSHACLGCLRQNCCRSVGD
jgi:hypothetical protein